MPDRGAPDEYEVIWRSGQIDRVKAHQVTWKGGDSLLSLYTNRDAPTQPERVRFHGEVDGQWRLMLDAPVEDIATIRNLTQTSDRYE